MRHLALACYTILIAVSIYGLMFSQTQHAILWAVSLCVWLWKALDHA